MTRLLAALAGSVFAAMVAFAGPAAYASAARPAYAPRFEGTYPTKAACESALQDWIELGWGGECLQVPTPWSLYVWQVG